MSQQTCKWFAWGCVSWDINSHR